MKLNLLVAASFLLVVPTAVFSQPRTVEIAPPPESGDPAAVYEQGRALLAGDGVPKDEKKAFELIKAAADKDYLPAIAGVAYLYSAGIGVEKDPAAAAKGLRIAAARDHAISRYNLGKLLIADEIPLPAGSTDRAVQHTEGVEWIRKAADQGQIEAKADYGIILMRGDFGVKPDPTASAPYLLAAAAAGNAEALNALGTMYLVGNGVPYDLGAAERSFRQAAMQGHVKAQANLGELLDPSSGEPEKRVEALAWLYLAEQVKDPVAMKILQNKAAVISPGDEAAGRKKAASLRKEMRGLKK